MNKHVTTTRHTNRALTLALCIGVLAVSLAFATYRISTGQTGTAETWDGTLYAKRGEHLSLFLTLLSNDRFIRYIPVTWNVEGEGAKVEEASSNVITFTEGSGTITPLATDGTALPAALTLPYESGYAVSYRFVGIHTYKEGTLTRNTQVEKDISLLYEAVKEGNVSERYISFLNGSLAQRSRVKAFFSRRIRNAKRKVLFLYVNNLVVLYNGIHYFPAYDDVVITTNGGIATNTLLPFSALFGALSADGLAGIILLLDGKGRNETLFKNDGRLSRELANAVSFFPLSSKSVVAEVVAYLPEDVPRAVIYNASETNNMVMQRTHEIFSNRVGTDTHGEDGRIRISEFVSAFPTEMIYENTLGAISSLALTSYSWMPPQTNFTVTYANVYTNERITNDYHYIKRNFIVYRKKVTNRTKRILIGKDSVNVRTVTPGYWK